MCQPCVWMGLDSGDRATASPSAANNLWSAAMFPLADQLFMLQTNLLFDIAAHDLVKNTNAASTRILDISKKWNTWIAQNAYKAHVAGANSAMKTLGWQLVRAYWGGQAGGQQGRQRLPECHILGMNACETMKCELKDYPCAHSHNLEEYLSSRRWCGEQACYPSTAVDFYWQYLGPKSLRLKFQVEKMITTLEMKGF